jgi:hypothetical protein
MGGVCPSQYPMLPGFFMSRLSASNRLSQSHLALTRRDDAELVPSA